MPRDSSGNYTLPAGNPVVTGTTVDSSWANNTMEDLRAAMQDSLSRSGDGGMLVPFQFSDGSAAAPGATFSSETTSGLYRAGTNDLRISVAGSDRVQFRNNATDPLRIYSSGVWKTVLHEASTGVTVTGDWTFTGTLTVPEATVTAHQAALTILESQITDGSILARVGSTETITDVWTFSAQPVFNAGIKLNDNNQAIFGTGSDMALYHSGTQNILRMLTDQVFRIENNAGNQLIIATPGQGVSLHYNNVLALEASLYTEAGFGTGGKVQDGLGTLQPVGFNVLPIYEIDASDTFDLAHNGRLWHKDSGAAVTFTCDQDANIPQGATYTIANEDTEDITIAQGTGVTLRWFDGSGAPSTGNRTLGQGGLATVYKYQLTEFWIWGVGIT